MQFPQNTPFFGPPWCQSCAATIQSKIVRGTNADGSLSDEYCMHCYQNGAFTHPNITMEDMIEAVVRGIMKQMGRTEAQARSYANNMIPRMKRWRTQEPLATQTARGTRSGINTWKS